MKVLFSVVKNEQLLRTSKASNDPSSADKLDPSKPFYELYKQVYFEFPWADKEMIMLAFFVLPLFFTQLHQESSYVCKPWDVM